MAQDPSILVQPTGTPFLTAPDGTTAPDVAGDPVDLTGVPLTVAPSYAGDTGRAAVIDAFGFGILFVKNLLPGNLGPELVGKRLELIGAQEGDSATITVALSIFVTGLANMTNDDVGRFLVVKGAVNPGNNGVFLITEVANDTSITILNPAAVAETPISWRRSDFFTGIPSRVAVNTGNAGIFDIGAVPDPVSLDVFDADGMAADQWSGEIVWHVLPALADFPAGDPLTIIAEEGLPLNVISTTPGPATFGDYDPILPPEIGQETVNPAPVNAGGGNEDPGPLQASGVGTPVVNDEQNPPRFQLSAEIPNNPEGIAQVMQSPPKTTNYGVFIAVKSP